MKAIYACSLSVCLVGCAVDDGRQDGDESAVAQPTGRPPLSSICALRCNNSHGQRSCFDHRDAGQTNVAVYPLIEGTTKVPSSILNLTTGWASTSCPNCVWQLDSVTTSEGLPPNVLQNATNGPGVFKVVAARPEYEWFGALAIRIWDPTDASVGTCNLSVDIELTGGIAL